MLVQFGHFFIPSQDGFLPSTEVKNRQVVAAVDNAPDYIVLTQQRFDLFGKDDKTPHNNVSGMLYLIPNTISNENFIKNNQVYTPQTGPYKPFYNVCFKPRFEENLQNDLLAYAENRAGARTETHEKYAALVEKNELIQSISDEHRFPQTDIRLPSKTT